MFTELPTQFTLEQNFTLEQSLIPVSRLETSLDAPDHCRQRIEEPSADISSL